MVNTYTRAANEWQANNNCNYSNGFTVEVSSIVYPRINGVNQAYCDFDYTSESDGAVGVQSGCTNNYSWDSALINMGHRYWWYGYYYDDYPQATLTPT